MDPTQPNPPSPTTPPAAPVTPAAPVEQLQPDAPQEPSVQPASAKPSILIVEDDPLLVKMYTTKFNKEGFDVISAQDGEEGLQMVKSNNIDFMILDVMMPKLSGIDMLTQLQADPNKKNIPTIVLTNLTQKEEAMKLQNMGVKEYLVKANLTPSEVVTKVKQYLAGTPAPTSTTP